MIEGKFSDSREFKNKNAKKNFLKYLLQIST